MESSDFYLVFSRPFVLASRRDTLPVLPFFVRPSTQPHAWTHLLTACPHAVVGQGTGRPPEFPGFPSDEHARLYDAGGSVATCLLLDATTLMPSAITTTSASHHETHFSAQSPWPALSLSTLNPQRHHWRPKTRFRVKTNLARVGFTPTGNLRTVSIK